MLRPEKPPPTPEPPPPRIIPGYENYRIVEISDGLFEPKRKMFGFIWVSMAPRKIVSSPSNWRLKQHKRVAVTYSEAIAIIFSELERKQRKKQYPKIVWRGRDIDDARYEYLNTHSSH